MNTFIANCIRVAAAGAIATVGIFVQSAASAAPLKHQCGLPLNSTVLTEFINHFSTQSDSFVNITGAVLNVAVPTGQTRCIKVRFFIEGRCTVTAAPDKCFIRADVDGVAMDPQQNGILFVTENDISSAHAFEWVKVLGQGTHNIRMKAAVIDTMTTFDIFAWTMDVEMTK